MPDHGGGSACISGRLPRIASTVRLSCSWHRLASVPAALVSIDTACLWAPCRPIRAKSGSLAGRFRHPFDILPNLPRADPIVGGDGRRLLYQEDPLVAVDGPKGCAKIGGDGVAERFQVAHRRSHLCCPCPVVHPPRLAATCPDPELTRRQPVIFELALLVQKPCAVFGMDDEQHTPCFNSPSWGIARYAFERSRDPTGNGPAVGSRLQRTGIVRDDACDAPMPLLAFGEAFPALLQMRTCDRACRPSYWRSPRAGRTRAPGRRDLVLMVSLRDDPGIPHDLGGGARDLS